MRKFLSIIFLFLSASYVSAQGILEYETRTFAPYWYVGANVAANWYMAEGNDFLAGTDGVRFSFKDNSGTTFRATLGRRLTPVIGIRGYAGINKYKWLSSYTNNPVVSFNSEFATADLTISIVNLLEESYSLKKYDFGFFVGTGFELRNRIRTPTAAVSESSISPVGRVGLEGNFLLSSDIALTLGGELNFVNDNNNGLVAGRNYEFIPAVSVGLNYYLKSSKK